MNLSKEEKAIVTHQLTEDYGFVRTLSVYFPYLLPPCILAVYGFIQQEPIAQALAFAVLLLQVIWYIYQMGRSGKHLKSALEKYEKKVSALE